MFNRKKQVKRPSSGRAPRQSDRAQLPDDAALQLLEKRAQSRSVADRKAPARPRRRVRTARQRKQARYRRVLRVLSRLFFLGLIVTAGILALTLFFRVDKLTVTGETRYSQAALLKTADVSVGDNLFLLRKSAVEKRLRAAYPYLEEIRIVRQMPGELVIAVSDAVPAVALAQGEVCYLMSEHGQLLEQRQLTGLTGTPVVRGVLLDKPKIGKKLDMSRDESLRCLDQLLEALVEQKMLSDVTFINQQQRYDIRVGYLGRFDLRLGSLDQVSYKFRFAKTIINDYLSPSELRIIELENVPQVHSIPTTEEEIAASAVWSGAEQTEGKNETT